MARLRSWLLRWLWSDQYASYADLNRVETAHAALRCEIAALKSGLGEAITEINQLRNAMPQHMQATGTGGAIRRVPFRSFAAAAALPHTPQPIALETRK